MQFSLRTSRKFFALLLLLMGVESFGLGGCLTKPDPLPNTDFLLPGRLVHSDTIPFQKVWFKPGLDLTKYHEIYIASVHTDYLLKMNWWQELERGSSIREDLPGLALFVQQTLKEAFRRDPRNRFKVVEIPKQGTLVLRFALVEVVPTKTALKVAGFIPPVAIPARLVGLGSKSTAAFEARLEEGIHGKVIAMFADREAAKFTIASVKDFTWYGHAKGMIEEWADQLVKVLNKKPGEAIKDSGFFELKPW